MNTVAIIANPRSGRADIERVRLQAMRWLAEPQVDVRVLAAGERAVDATALALEGGAGLVVAAGGDGTVSGVARALVGTGVPLAIVPMGTANQLAEQLGVPKSPEKAMELALHEHDVRPIDALRVAQNLHFLNAGVGVSSDTVRKMKDGDKRRLGVMAYVFTGMGSSLGFPPAEFRLTVDGVVTEFRGIEVSLINAGFRDAPNLPNLPDIQPDDGVIDVLVVWTPTPAGYLRHLRNALLRRRPVEPNVKWLRARSEVHIEADRPMAMQADGDLVAETPVRLSVVRGAVGVVVPPRTDQSVGS